MLLSERRHDYKGVHRGREGWWVGVGPVDARDVIGWCGGLEVG